jgi:hypothetical protein
LLWIKVDSFVPIILPNLNPICHLLALGAHHILHVGRIRVNGSPNVTVYRYEIFVQSGSSELMLQRNLVKPSTGNWISCSFTLEMVRSGRKVWLG